jgi:hypothetical protein
MGLDKNGLDGSGAMDDESRRWIREDLLRTTPLLRYNPSALQEMVEAIHKGSEAGWRPSEAINSSGNVNDSDLNRDLGREGFFSDMEGYRQREMVSPDTMSPTTDPEDDRFFGENQPSPGQAFVAKHGAQVTASGTVDDDTKAMNVPSSTIRRMPAAGRFGIRRSR